MKRLGSILRNRRGLSTPLAVCITLALLLLFCCISEYLRLQTIASGVRDAVQSAAIATVTENYAEVYHAVREGYSGAYQPTIAGFEESLNYGNVYDRLDRLLGLTPGGGWHSSYNADGSVEYRLRSLTVEFQNAPLAAGDQSGERFFVNCTIELEVPVSFAGKLLPSMRITVKTSAGYTPTF